MSIDRALQWTTAAVAVVGALFLALGHESGWLPALLAIAAAFSVLVTDLIPRLRLNRIAGNLIALAAVAWSLYDFLDRNSDQQLMAISQMLVILQVMLLFQEKTGRAYWQLLVLSLLQVVVAAALNSGLEFGVLLGVYMLLSLLALVLLCMHRELTADRLPPPSAEPATLPPWKSLLAPPQVNSSVHSARNVALPLAGRLLLRQLLALVIATASLTAVFFYMTPRLSDSAWRSQRTTSSRMTGISQQIELEEFGRIHQSNQVVLRVILTNHSDGSPFTMIGEPYFHGGVLTHYERESNRSRWVYAPRRSLEGFGGVSYPRSRTPPRPLVRQECMLELVNSPVAFAIFPFRWSPGTEPDGFQLERAAMRIMRTNSDIRSTLSEVRYTGYTSALQHGRQLRAAVHANPAVSFDHMVELQDELDELRTFDAERFSGLKAVAESVLRDAQVDEADSLERALALERHFRFSNLYRYSLQLDFDRDQRLDPIEDFVVNHHTGHCEYFASALVLMLRSQGIPARIAIGYKGGEFNMLGQYFVVRQKHAHAWVEAWMPPGAVPDAEIAGNPHQGGCWYRLDPTPASNEYLAAMSDSSFQGQITDTFDYLELLWRDYVVNLNALRQHRAVIDPGAESTLDALPDWIDTRALDRWSRQVRQRLGLQPPRRAAAQRRIFDWRIVVIVASVFAVLIGLSQLVAFLWRRLSARVGWGSAERKSFHRPPPFYRRFEALLARTGLRRGDGQTAAEFAERARSTLAGKNHPASIADLPPEVVQAYYRVRFGGHALDNSETEAIEHALAKLVPAVSRASSASAATTR
jgi:transglutaminase-like putative cysteine protease